MGDFLITHARIATMRGARYGWIEDGALLARSGIIAWIGATSSMPRSAAGAVEAVHAHGALLTPGLIDCHTHLVHAGDRSAEHALRREGATYAQIAAAGGGILATVRATRAASDAELAGQALARLDAMALEGVTTVEIKSGYGLDVETEIRCLRVARALADARPMRIETTLLGAHALAPEYAGRADDYITLVCEEMIPRAAREGLAGAVDAFCETVGFTPEQTRRVFEAARRHGLAVKLHADQLTNQGGAALAAEFHALSADHLEYTDAPGVAALAAAGTVAVLLPGAYEFLGERQVPPVADLRRLGVPMAVATDCNPGTSPTTSLLKMMSLACELFGLGAEEALAGVTHQAARALGRNDRGCLESGRLADCALWDLEDPRDLAVATAARRPVRRFFAS